MPPPISSRAPAALFAVLGLAICTGIVVHARHGGAPAPEAARASSTTPGVAGLERGDVDGDGVADCWSLSRHADPDTASDVIELAVWRSCTEPAAKLSTTVGAMVVLEVPPPYRTPRWLPWIAGKLVPPDQVSCAGLALPGCRSPDPGWRWMLATESASPPAWTAPARAHGRNPPAWQPMSSYPAAVARALIMPWAPRDWQPRGSFSTRFDSADVPPDDGPRIVVDRLGPAADVRPIACAGLEIRAEPRGILGVDPAGARWTWLFHGFGGFSTRKLICRDGVVIASTGGVRSNVLAIEPRSGGWLLEASEEWLLHCHDLCQGATLHRDPGGWLWWWKDRTAIPLTALRDWLALPGPGRPELAALVSTARPELADPSAAALADAQRFRGEGPIGKLSKRRALTEDLRRGLTPRGTCAGWQLLASTTAVLAERGEFARWLVVEPRDLVERIQTVRCDAGRVLVEQASALDELSGGRAQLPLRDALRQEVAVQLAWGWWSSRSVD